MAICVFGYLLVLCSFFEINHDYLFPILIISFPLGYGVSQLFNYIVIEYKRYQKEKDILSYLKHLNIDEKEFIKYCIKHNVQTKLVHIFKCGILSSLQSKSIAYTSGTNDINSMPLTIPNNVWKILQKNKKLFM